MAAKPQCLRLTPSVMLVKATGGRHRTIRGVSKPGFAMTISVKPGDVMLVSSSPTAKSVALTAGSRIMPASAALRRALMAAATPLIASKSRRVIECHRSRKPAGGTAMPEATLDKVGRGRQGSGIGATLRPHLGARAEGTVEHRGAPADQRPSRAWMRSLGRHDLDSTGPRRCWSSWPQQVAGAIWGDRAGFTGVIV